MDRPERDLSLEESVDVFFHCLFHAHRCWWRAGVSCYRALWPIAVRQPIQRAAL